LKQISARLRSLVYLIPIWFTLFAAIFLAANYGSSRYLHHLDHGRQIAKESQAAAESREEARATFARYGLNYFQRVYPGKSESEIVQLIQDQAKTPVSYEPFVEFRSSPYISPTLNIHSAGFRLIGPAQGPWPIDKNALNLFVFGGSMALGSAVADDDAIPAQLQHSLRARTGLANLNVYNFAAGSHFSSQEVAYLQNLLRAGIVPNIAVFIDGQNDFYFGMERHQNLHFSVGSSDHMAHPLRAKIFPSKPCRCSALPANCGRTSADPQPARQRPKAWKRRRPRK
jgi:hypothetical protein